MAVSRRRFLQGLGVTLIAVTGGTVYRAIDQGVLSSGQGPAYEQWRNWRSEMNTPVERVVMAGILASNPHNSQPWLFQITPDSVTLIADRTRQIGTIDPFLREMVIGLGCALENMLLAASAEGFTVDLALVPDGDNAPTAARLQLSAGQSSVSALYEAIPNRRTDRSAFAPEPIAEAELAEMTDLNADPNVQMFWFHTEADRARFGDIAIRSVEVLIQDEQQSIDSHVWWRHDWQEIQARQDGLTLDAQPLNDVVAGLAKIIPDVSRQEADRIFLETVRNTQVPTAAAFGMIAVRDGRAASQQLACGRYWQRLHLYATTRGLAMHPLNQMCERADRELQLSIATEFGDAIRGLLGDDEWTGIMPFRVGYPAGIPRLSPRRSLEKVLI